MRTPLIILTAALVASAGTLPAHGGWDEGVAAFQQKNYEAASREFRELVDQTPDGYRGQYMLGMSLARLDRKEEALAHLRKAYDLNPNELSVKLELGRAYLAVRKYQEVSNLLGSVNPSSLPANAQPAFYQMRGEARLKTNNDNGAFSDFEKLAQLKPKDAATQYKFGAVALKADRLDTAIVALDRAVRLDGSDIDMKRTYANALVKKGRMTQDRTEKKTRYLKAAELAREIVAADGNFDNLMLKMSAELGAGLYSDAVKTGGQAQAKNSSDWIVPFYIGQAYTSDGKYAQSVEPLKKALSLAGPNDQKKVWTQLGFAYEKQKNYAASADAYTKAGNQSGVQRVSDNMKIASDNERIEAENAQIQAMEQEAKRLEAELKKLEEGGGL